MAVTIPTDDFLTLLKAARITSYKGKDDPTLASAYVTTVTIDDPSGSGTTSALTAISTDALVVGQITYPCEGSIDPLLLDLSQVAWLEKMLSQAKKNMAELEGKNSDFTVSLTVGGDGMLIVETLTNGMKGEKDTRGEINLGNPDDFPVQVAMSDLNQVKIAPPKDDGNNPIPEGRLQSSTKVQSDVLSGALGVFKEPVNQWTLGHIAGRRVFTSGGVWRAVVPGSVPESDLDVNEPDVETVPVPTSGAPVDDQGDD